MSNTLDLMECEKNPLNGKSFRSNRFPIFSSSLSVRLLIRRKKKTLETFVIIQPHNSFSFTFRYIQIKKMRNCCKIVFD